MLQPLPSLLSISSGATLMSHTLCLLSLMDQLFFVLAVSSTLHGWPLFILTALP